VVAPQNATISDPARVVFKTLPARSPFALQQATMTLSTKLFVALTLAGASLAASAQTTQTTVSDAWIRGTVAQQKVTGMFAKLTSAAGAKLVGASSPAAASVEVHEMKMDGDRMTMGAVPVLDLPAGKAVELKPGGYHIMLLGLKQPLKAGDKVAVTLLVEGKDGKRENVEVQAEVRALGAQAPAGHDGQHKH
jgi:copper(I)-binding protein